MNFSIGIYSCPMDPMDSIGTTFHPLIQHEQDFSKSLTNRKLTFPSVKLANGQFRKLTIGQSLVKTPLGYIVHLTLKSISGNEGRFVNVCSAVSKGCIQINKTPAKGGAEIQQSIFHVNVFPKGQKTSITICWIRFGGRDAKGKFQQ